jgi:RNA polymerase sigma-70 factor (ECF subfamily)
MSDLPQARQSLLIQLGSRSGNAWEQFLAVYESAILQLCRSRGLQDSDAQDVIQEVLLAVHQRILDREHDASKGRFRDWLMRVARNICVDSISARARRALLSGDTALEQLPQGLSCEDLNCELEFDQKYRRSAFQWAAAEVQAEVRLVTWRAFQLTAIQGQAPGLVAAELKIPPLGPVAVLEPVAVVVNLVRVRPVLVCLVEVGKPIAVSIALNRHNALGAGKNEKQSDHASFLIWRCRATVGPRQSISDCQNEFDRP